jgi:hypothetical protein
VEGLEEALYVRNILNELFPSVTIHAIVDSKSLVKASHSTKSVDDRRLRVDLTCIKQSLGSCELNSLRWCPAAAQLANVLTKSSASGSELRSVLQVGTKPSFLETCDL